jgi:hypothetical protein
MCRVSHARGVSLPPAAAAAGLPPSAVRPFVLSGALRRPAASRVKKISGLRDSSQQLVNDVTVRSGDPRTRERKAKRMEVC